MVSAVVDPGNGGPEPLGQTHYLSGKS